MVIKHGDFPMSYVEEKKYKYMYIDEKDYKGHLGQIHIIKANQPPKDLGEDYIERASSGCKWLEFYPENSNIAMTVCYNKENKILNWYFDIMQNVKIKDNNPYFEDLYLDVTITPNNVIKLLDGDELEEALNKNDISKEQYKLAYKCANELIAKIEGKVEALTKFSNKYFEKINLIDEVKDEDIGEQSVQSENVRKRYGARGIIKRGDGKIAVFNKALKKEYKLPGGGFDKGEDSAEAFKREVFEETGCKIEIIDFLGTIKELKTKDNFEQISYVYIGELIEDTKQLHPTIEEAKEGANVFWESPEVALKLIKNCFNELLPSPCEEDSLSIYHTKFIVKRDEKILETYLNNKQNI